MKESSIIKLFSITFFCYLLTGLSTVNADHSDVKIYDQNKPTVFITGSNRGIGFGLA